VNGFLDLKVENILLFNEDILEFLKKIYEAI
jgi:hypothetical protein